MDVEETEERRLLDGRYEVTAVLGGGGTAVVYLGRHAALGRDVAIKVIRPEVFGNERELLRYMREARIIAALNHPNIVTLFDVGRLPDQRPYMVMEYVAGQSLNRMLQDGEPLPIDLALHVFEQVARALGHAHRHGVIHRDIKPGNILLRQRSTGYPTVKVADFGVASVASSTVTHQGAFIGTPMYMSPEQAQGQPVVAASDLYSLGIVMYRALTGVRPFDSESPVALAMCHVTERVRPPREVAPYAGIPEDLEAIVMKCLEKDPGRRFTTADELLVALERVKARHWPLLSPHSQDSLEVVPVAVGPLTTRRGVALVAGLATVLVLLAFLGGVGVSELLRRAPGAPAAPAAERAPVPAVLPAASPEPPAPAVESTPAPIPQREPARERIGGSARRAPDRDLRPPPPPAPGPLAASWEGELDGKRVVLELGSHDGEVVEAALDARAPGFDSRRLVGRITSTAADRRHLALVDDQRGIVLELELLHDHAFGTVRAGTREKRMVLFPR